MYLQNQLEYVSDCGKNVFLQPFALATLIKNRNTKSDIISFLEAWFLARLI